jgi:hypothetical protein
MCWPTFLHHAPSYQHTFWPASTEDQITVPGSRIHLVTLSPIHQALCDLFRTLKPHVRYNRLVNGVVTVLLYPGLGTNHALTRQRLPFSQHWCRLSEPLLWTLRLTHLPIQPFVIAPNRLQVQTAAPILRDVGAIVSVNELRNAIRQASLLCSPPLLLRYQQLNVMCQKRQLDVYILSDLPPGIRLCGPDTFVSHDGS